VIEVIHLTSLIFFAARITPSRITTDATHGCVSSHGWLFTLNQKQVNPLFCISGAMIVLPVVAGEARPDGQEMKNSFRKRL
jgi:hypothetical protein